MQLLFESSYYSRAAFINLGTDDEEIHCLKQGGVAADARESIRRDTAMLATVTDTKFEESDSSHADVEEDKDLFQGVLWLARNVLGTQQIEISTSFGDASELLNLWLY